MKKLMSLVAAVAFLAVVGCGETKPTTAPTTKPSGSAATGETKPTGEAKPTGETKPTTAPTTK